MVCYRRRRVGARNSEIICIAAVQTCSAIVSLAIARSIAGPGPPNFCLKLAPRLYPVLHRFHPGHRAAPSAMAMRVKKVGVGFFQVFLAASAGRCQRPFAFRAGKQQHVRKMLYFIWQTSLAFRGSGGILRLLQTGCKHKSLYHLLRALRTSLFGILRHDITLHSASEIIETAIR